MSMLENLTPLEIQAAYEKYRLDEYIDEINTCAYENEYLKELGITKDLTPSEIKEAALNMISNVNIYTDWSSFAREAIDEVLAKRPKEDLGDCCVKAPDTYYNKVLEMYGLSDGQPFKLKGINNLIYHFDGGDLLYTETLDAERAELSDYTLGNFLFLFKKEDIEPVEVSKPKPQAPDLLNETLKKIGLETNQFFRINDDEFAGDDFYIDSFGDVYIINGHPDVPDDRDPETDEQHEFLTLGHILTQYPDKIVPWDVKETGYA